LNSDDIISFSLNWLTTESEIQETKKIFDKINKKMPCINTFDDAIEYYTGYMVIISQMPKCNDDLSNIDHNAISFSSPSLCIKKGGTGIPVSALATVGWFHYLIANISTCKSPLDILKRCLLLGGDTDTIAAYTFPISYILFKRTEKGEPVNLPDYIMSQLLESNIDLLERRLIGNLCPKSKCKRIKVYITNTDHKRKHTIIFIHGLKKHYNSWNVTEKGKEIGLEKTFNQTCNTVLVQIDEEDYLKPINDIAESIYNELQQLLFTKIILVSHSQGSFYCLALAKNYPKIFSRIVMLNPTIKTPAYYNYLTKKKDINIYRLNHFSELPDHTNLHCQVIFFIHIDIDSTKSDEDKLILFDKIIQLNKITNKNVKSKLCVHADVSHMIHYMIPETICNSIKDICNM